MLSREEFKKAYTRIMDERRNKNIGECNCSETHCDEGCLFYNDDVKCLSGEALIDKIYNSLELVENWAKEHPFVTMRDKYKEVFGAEPKLRNGSYLCPRYLGFNDVKCESGSYCAKCRDEFWHSEYTEPKKGSE